MRLNIYLCFIFILCSAISFSQIAEPSSGIGKHILQIETEVQYAVNKEGVEKCVTWSLPSFLFRYGLLEEVELQLNVPLIVEQLYKNNYLVHTFNRFENIQIGASINLWKQRNVIPETAFMVRAILPVQNYREFNVSEIMALNLSSAILEKWTLSYNIGFIHRTGNCNEGYYIVNLTYDLNQKKHFFIEYFSDTSFFLQNINIGGGFNFKKNRCLDFSVANGINHDLFYTNLRFTWVMNTKK